MQENNQTNVKKILLDLADHLGAKGIRGLASALGENESKLYAWINRGTIGDQAAIIKKCPTIRTSPDTIPRIAGISRAATARRSAVGNAPCRAPPNAGTPAVRPSSQAIARLMTSSVVS